MKSLLSKPMIWLALPLTLAMSLSATPAQARMHYDRGDRIEHRLDIRGDRIDRRLDRRAAHQLALGHLRRAAQLDRRGDRIDRRLDRLGARIDARYDRHH